MEPVFYEDDDELDAFNKQSGALRSKKEDLTVETVRDKILYLNHVLYELIAGT